MESEAVHVLQQNRAEAKSRQTKAAELLAKHNKATEAHVLHTLQQNNLKAKSDQAKAAELLAKHKAQHAKSIMVAMKDVTEKERAESIAKETQLKELHKKHLALNAFDSIKQHHVLGQVAKDLSGNAILEAIN